MWFRKKKGSFRFQRTPKKRKKTVSVHYEQHKELARKIILERLSYWNQFYQLEYKRVAIRNQKRCWGSCSGKRNLNFNYKIILLPQTLMDYVIVHELCHLAELNHSSRFWQEVEKVVPDYREKRVHLRKMTHIPQNGFPSSVFYDLA